MPHLNRRTFLRATALGVLAALAGDAVLPTLAEAVGTTGPRTTRGAEARYTLEAAEKLKSFDRPVLLAWAVEDKLFPLEYAHRLAAELPDATVEEIHDSYTFIPEDQPDRLADAIATFVRRPASVSA